MVRTGLCDGLRVGSAAGVLVMAAVFSMAGAAPRAGAVGPKDAGRAGAVTILDGASCWRVLHSWTPVRVRTAEGIKDRASTGRRVVAVDRADFRFMTLYPKGGYADVGFDDASWARLRFHGKFTNGEPDSRAGGGSASRHLRQLTLRGRFTVEKPVPMRLSVAFRGGLIAHLNGREIHRAYLPEGPIKPGSPARIYPKDVYINPKGKPWNWWGDRKTIAAGSYARRVRRVGWDIPASRVRRGLNVLTVEIHSAPYPAEFMNPKF
ncbi:MAG: hypothetical protein ACYS5V_07835, partial [Planctomycetota bacterium]